MHIKKFRAANMTQALGLVKKEFGPDAVILSAVNIKNNRSLFGRQQSGVEVTAARESGDTGLRADGAPSGRSGYGRYAKSQNGQRPGLAVSAAVGPVYDRYGTYRPTDAPGRSVGGFSHADVRELYAIYQQMLAQEVEDHLAMDLLAGVCRNLPSVGRMRVQRLKPALADVFETVGIAFRPIKFKPGKKKVVTLVGPTGVGKTTTAAKLAAIAKYRTNRKPVALITVDNCRLGGAAQLEKFAEILGVPFQFAGTRKTLNRAITRFKDKDLIVIDTPGIGPGNQQPIEDLHRMLAKIDQMETHLLLDATRKETDQIKIVQAYSKLAIDGLIFTKIDEGATYGSALNRAMRTKIPLAYFTKGQQVPEDIETATADRLVSLILDESRTDSIWSKPPELLAMEIDKFRNRLESRIGGDGVQGQNSNYVSASADIFEDFSGEKMAGAL